MKIKFPNWKKMKNNRWILGLVVIIILIAGFVVFDFKNSRKQNTKPKTDSVLSVENLKNASYNIEGDEFKLVDGTFRYNDSSDDSNNFLAELDTEHIAYGNNMAAVIITQHEGASGQFRNLLIMGINKDNQIKQISTTIGDLEDRSVIQIVSFLDNTISIKGLFHGLNDGMCCPTLEKTLVYNLTSDDKLVLRPNSNDIKEVAAAETCKKPISQEEAVQVVKKLPEVQQFINKVGWNKPAPEVTSEPTVDFDAEVGNYYSIHVYELVSDKNYNDSHTATFNWYKVDKCTGEIRCSFSVYAKDDDGSYKYLRETDDKECNGAL